MIHIQDEYSRIVKETNRSINNPYVKEDIKELSLDRSAQMLVNYNHAWDNLHFDDNRL